MAVVPDGEPGGRGRVAFLAFEEGGFVGVGGLGGDDLEDPAAEDPQRLGVVVGGQAEQLRLGLSIDVGVEVVGQLGSARGG